MSTDGPPPLLAGELHPDERVEWHHSPDPWDPLASWLGPDPTNLTVRILLVATVALPAVGAAAVLLFGGSVAYVYGIGLVTLFVAPAVPTTWLVNRWYGNLAYAATDRRVLRCSGLLGPSCRTIRWTDVGEVELEYNHHGVPKKLVVRERSGGDTAAAGGDPLEFEHLSAPEAAEVRIRGLRDEHTPGE